MTRTAGAVNWTNDEDLTLANIILQSIRQGTKISFAYDSASELIGRSRGACKNRWNTVLAKLYVEAIEEASAFQSVQVKGHSESEDYTIKGLIPLENTIVDFPLKQNSDEGVPVTTGVQQEINFDTGVLSDQQIASTVDFFENLCNGPNPLSEMRKLLDSFESTYSQLQDDNKKLIEQNRGLASENFELKESLASATANHSVENFELSSLKAELEEAKKQLEAYHKIKAVFNEVV
ncbi:hypothetical protein C2I27_03700 [Priestia megaterium]|uniref:hypothetical protein n=1 Tax=Priestia megaterium TaxID=1404 RepID=UPI000D51E246|nr:hypothetical protein [Priestia megaterium]PVC75004.1 hypothetical protein C2I27_03700 [Priestia megaterium]